MVKFKIEQITTINFIKVYIFTQENNDKSLIEYKYVMQALFPYFHINL